MASSNHELVSEWLAAAWMNPEFADVGRFHHDNFEAFDPQHGGCVRGLDGVQGFLAQMRESFSHTSVEVLDMVEEGNIVAARLAVSAHHHGDYMGHPPTNETVSFSVMCWWEIEEGKFRRCWELVNCPAILNQIGAGDPDITLNSSPHGGRAPDTLGSTGSESRNKETVRKWMDTAWNQGDISIANELVARDMWFWDATSPQINNLDEFNDWVKGIDQTFSDTRLDIEGLIAQGEKTAYRVTISGRHTGPFLGVEPSDVRLCASAIIFVTHKDGQFWKAWQQFDVLTLKQQMLGKGPASSW